jgi:hypothetical protein
MINRKIYGIVYVIASPVCVLWDASAPVDALGVCSFKGGIPLIGWPIRVRVAWLMDCHPRKTRGQAEAALRLPRNDSIYIA